MTQASQPKSEAAAGPPANQPAHIGYVRFSAAQFLLALVLFFIVAPLVDELPYGNFVDGTLLSLVLASGVFAVGRRRKTLVWAAILGAPVIVCRWVSHYRPDLVPRHIFLGVALMFAAFVVANLLHFVLRAPRVNSEVLCAGIAGYLMLGLLWAFAYLLVSRMGRAPFAFGTGAPPGHSLGDFEALYFSFITLSTVGYGDITPLSNAARMLAMMEAMTGTLFVAVFIARQVAMYSSENLHAGDPAALEIREPKI